MRDGEGVPGTSSANSEQRTQAKETDKPAARWHTRTSFRSIGMLFYSDIVIYTLTKVLDLESGIERRAVSVALGVSQYTVAVEN